VSFPPGGGVDAVARLFADKMSPMLGQPVVVENRGGASGTIAGKQVATASPDGYSVLVASNSMLVATVMNPRSGLDIARELHAIASTAPQAVIVVARPDVPAASLKRADRACAHAPAQLRPSPGVGSVPHPRSKHPFTTIENARMEHIRSRRGAGAHRRARRPDRGRGGDLPPAVAAVAAGKPKGIAVRRRRTRVAALPEVPTTTEAGYPNVVVTVRNGFFVPAKTPKAIADKLGETILARSPPCRMSSSGSPNSASSPPASRASSPARRRHRAQDLGRHRGEGRHQAQ
jgi:tripartite-type tricarboxylate transporter receptor subunit TctC